MRQVRQGVFLDRLTDHPAAEAPSAFGRHPEQLLEPAHVAGWNAEAHQPRRIALLPDEQVRHVCVVDHKTGRPGRVHCIRHGRLDRDGHLRSRIAPLQDRGVRRHGGPPMCGPRGLLARLSHAVACVLAQRMLERALHRLLGAVGMADHAGRIARGGIAADLHRRLFYCQPVTGARTSQRFWTARLAWFAADRRGVDLRTRNVRARRHLAPGRRRLGAEAEKHAFRNRPACGSCMAQCPFDAGRHRERPRPAAVADRPGIGCRPRACNGRARMGCHCGHGAQAANEAKPLQRGVQHRQPGRRRRRSIRADGAVRLRRKQHRRQQQHRQVVLGEV